MLPLYSERLSDLAAQAYQLSIDCAGRAAIFTPFGLRAFFTMVL
jgi:hypothetical protein